ncbi:YraN family protein [Patescibacteria group bacterium]
MKQKEDPRHIKVGKAGERLAVKHFVKHKFKILEQNYWKKFGEIDIIAEKDKILHFIEVKTVSYETDFDNYLPEENVHKFKRKRFARTINTYLAEKKVSYETEFQVDVVAVFFDPNTKRCRIRILEDVIL